MKLASAQFQVVTIYGRATYSAARNQYTTNSRRRQMEIFGGSLGSTSASVCTPKHKLQQLKAFFVLLKKRAAFTWNWT